MLELEQLQSQTPDILGSIVIPAFTESMLLFQ